MTGSAVLGNAGVLLASNCLGGQDTLSLRGFTSDKKRDWSVPLAGRSPLSADDVVTVVDRAGTGVQVLGSTGRRKSTEPLGRAVRATSRPAAYNANRSTVELATVSGGVVALHDVTGQFRWSRTMGGLPVDTSAGLLLAGRDQVQLIDAATGRVARAVPAAGVAPGDQIGLVGRGVVVGDAGGTSSYS